MWKKSIKGPHRYNRFKYKKNAKIASVAKPNQVLVGELIDNIFLSTPSTKNLKRFREIGSDPNRWNYRSHINGRSIYRVYEYL
jgi:hypothetical protein